MEEINKHPDHVVGYDGSLKDLAHAIGRMRYDKAGIFIREFSADIKKQAEADLARGRKDLSQKLFEMAKYLDEAKIEIDSAWEICEPYMKK